MVIGAGYKTQAETPPLGIAQKAKALFCDLSCVALTCCGFSLHQGHELARNHQIPEWVMLEETTMNHLLRQAIP